MSTKKSAIVIGAGISGIATACLLAKHGYAVRVFEKQAEAGGRAGILRVEGFTFDTGPSWYLMPEVFEHFFTLLGEDVASHLDLLRLDPAYKVFFEHQEPLVIHADLKRDSATFDAIEPGASERLEHYLHDSAATYHTALESFLYTNFDSFAPFASRNVLRSSSKLLSRAFTPIDTHVRSYFDDRRLRQIMEYPMVFLGTSPFKAPAIYSLMSHMDFTQGVYYPQGGMYRIIDALMQIAKKHGVEFHFNCDVEKILYEGLTATGIEYNSKEQAHAETIISSADLHFTETHLLPPVLQTYPETYWEKKEASPSALLMYLGVKGTLPQLDHHNLFFVDDWKENFSTIFDAKAWPHPASIYVCKPSQHDPTVAPKGYENLFVLVPGPAIVESTDLEKLADEYLAQISRMAHIPDLAERIVVRRLVGPADFAQQFNAWQGSALGLSHVLSQSALFRPQNKSKKLRGLYYAGGNTVPGIGLPMCLISAQLVMKRLLNDKSTGPLEHIPKGNL